MDTRMQKFYAGTEFISRKNRTRPDRKVIRVISGNSASKVWIPHGTSRFPGSELRMGQYYRRMQEDPVFRSHVMASLCSAFRDKRESKNHIIPRTAFRGESMFLYDMIFSTGRSCLPGRYWNFEWPNTVPADRNDNISPVFPIPKCPFEYLHLKLNQRGGNGA